jgi:type IV pilus assembly protein PilO
MKDILAKFESVEPKQRWIICGLIAFLFGGLGYYLHSMNAATLETLTTEVEEMQQQVQKHQAIATRLGDLETRLTALDETLKVAITLLPESREIPELLTQISQLGLNSGLEFRLFRPEPEKQADFYAEVPVKLSIFGRFHELARFFDHLSKLPRIVNVTDIKIVPLKGKEDTSILATDCLLTTFRFIEPRETAGGKKADKSGRP